MVHTFSFAQCNTVQTLCTHAMRSTLHSQYGEYEYMGSFQFIKIIYIHVLYNSRMSKSPHGIHRDLVPSPIFCNFRAGGGGGGVHKRGEDTTYLLRPSHGFTRTKLKLVILKIFEVSYYSIC